MMKGLVLVPTLMEWPRSVKGFFAEPQGPLLGWPFLDRNGELESSVCREKLIFFGCEIVVVYTASRHFVQIRESETGAAAAALRRRQRRRRLLGCARANVVFFSISSPKRRLEGQIML